PAPHPWPEAARQSDREGAARARSLRDRGRGLRGADAGWVQPDGAGQVPGDDQVRRPEPRRRLRRRRAPGGPPRRPAAPPQRHPPPAARPPIPPPPPTHPGTQTLPQFGAVPPSPPAPRLQELVENFPDDWLLPPAPLAGIFRTGRLPAVERAPLHRVA